MGIGIAQSVVICSNIEFEQDEILIWEQAISNLDAKSGDRTSARAMNENMVEYKLKSLETRRQSALDTFKELGGEADPKGVATINFAFDEAKKAWERQGAMFFQLR
jgi:hypothetical protein